MSSRDHTQTLTGADGISLVDSLNALRELLDGARSDTVSDLVSVAASALQQHQDFDGCLAFLSGATSDRRKPASIEQSARGLPDFLGPIVSSEVIPLLMDEASVFIDRELADRCPEGEGGLLAVPIFDSVTVIGGLAVWSREPDRLMPWHQSLLDMMADVLAMSLVRFSGAGGAVVIDDAYSLTSDVVAGLSTTVPDMSQNIHESERTHGLSDRRGFERALESFAAASVSGLRTHYVLFIDIDRFRLIREYAGDMAAERMIRVFSDLLRREMAAEKLIGSLGNNQFGVVVERRSMEQATQRAESLVSVVDSLRLSFFGQRYDVSISIGVAQLRRGSGAGKASLGHAIQACQAAQKRGGGTVLSFQGNVAERRRSRSEGHLLNRLTRAMKDDTLELYAQAIAPLGELAESSSPSTMHEILLRMRDDEGGLIGAAAFLTLAERYGLSVKLDRWVIKRAFHEIASARNNDDRSHRFALNLSGHSIDDESLLSFIIEQFESSGLQPERICFEITETAAISDISGAKNFVQDLKKLGCKFALDDFGSGHSSFLYLRDLPIDYLKIDGELVREIVDDPVSHALVRTITDVARLMGRRSVAEFVENEDIRNAIAEIGCDYAQGYLIGHPVPLSDVLGSDEV
ncbi:MAG: EAL domain-containing protein [Pseudomonadota bacterium]